MYIHPDDHTQPTYMYEIVFVLVFCAAHWPVRCDCQKKIKIKFITVTGKYVQCELNPVHT